MFPHVNTDQHPQADGSRVRWALSTPLVEPGGEDFRIVEEILAIRRQIGQGASATGEWRWINEHRRSAYLDALEREDAPTLAKLFANLFRTEASHGVVSSDMNAFLSGDGQVALESQILRDIDTWREFTDHQGDDLSALNMPQVGNPYGVKIGETLIGTDTPRHDYFAFRLARLAAKHSIVRPCILEIGGGYGGLCLQLTRRLQDMCYIDCDLPEGLYATYYFLRRATSKRIAWVLGEAFPDHASADIFLVPAPRASIISGRVDMVFNANSLSEMAAETVAGYMALIHRLRPRYFLHQNSNILLFPDSPRHVEVLATDFPIDRSLYVEVYRAISPWQGAGGRYREFLYEYCG